MGKKKVKIVERKTTFDFSEDSATKLEKDFLQGEINQRFGKFGKIKSEVKYNKKGKRFDCSVKISGMSLSLIPIEPDINKKEHEVVLRFDPIK